MTFTLTVQLQTLHIYCRITSPALPRVISHPGKWERLSHDNNHDESLPAILPLISTSDPNTTAQLFIIALKMNYGANIRGIQFSPESIFHSLLSVKGTRQTGGIALLSICIPESESSHHSLLFFPPNLFWPRSSTLSLRSGCDEEVAIWREGKEQNSFSVCDGNG